MAKKHTSKNVYDFCVLIDEAVHSIELRLVRLEERGKEKEKLAASSLYGKSHTVSLCPVCGWDVAPDLPYCPNTSCAAEKKEASVETCPSCGWLVTREGCRPNCPAWSAKTRALQAEVAERREEILKLDAQVRDLRAKLDDESAQANGLRIAITEYQRSVKNVESSLSNERAENLRLRNLFALVKNTLLGETKR